MPDVDIIFPPLKQHRGPRYWLRVANLLTSQRKIFRADYSNEWRYTLERAAPPSQSRSETFASLTRTSTAPASFRFIVVADTGEGDHSQYSLLPLMHGVEADFMIINGDVAYPAGSHDDFEAGFFEPYASLGIPIWATAGNHEYYSRGNGREFHDIFCTRKASDSWSRHGIPHVPQPGMYWELRDPGDHTPLVVIGLDSGKKANLDGHTGWITHINPFGRSKRPDHEQHRWLEWRLQLADKQKKKVIVLYHIPGLRSRKHDKGTHLGDLHRILVRHPSVRLVMCGHIHNHQQFDPQTFRAYVTERHNASPPGHPPPHYVVSGNGGATLDSTVFKETGYKEVDVFPSTAQWREYTTMAQRVVDRLGGVKSVFTRVAGLIKKSAALDVDPHQLQSFLLIECTADRRVSVSLVHLDNLKKLYRDGVRTDITNPNPPLHDDAVQDATKHLFYL